MHCVPKLVQREDKRLTIRWSDGHVSVYAALDLRKACPCASCQDLHGTSAQDPFRIIDTNAPAPEALVLLRVEAVGNYALRFYWNDGHDTGIYTYEYLRQLG